MNSVEPVQSTTPEKSVKRYPGVEIRVSTLTGKATYRAILMWKGKRHKGTFHDHVKFALADHKRFEDNLVAGRPYGYDPNKPSAATCAAYIEKCYPRPTEGQPASKGGKRNREKYAEFWRKQLGDRLLSDIKHSDLADLLNRALTEGIEMHDRRFVADGCDGSILRQWDEGTAKKYFNFGKQLYKRAILDELTIRNPFEGLKSLKTGVKERWFTAEEFRRIEEYFVKTIKKPELWTCVKFAFQTGMRQKEQFNTKWSDVHLDHPSPHINLIEGRVKTRHARKVPLTAQAQAILRALPSYERSEWVFPDRSDYTKRINFGAIVRAYMKMLVKTGLKGDGAHAGDWHALRHSCGTHMKNAGCSDEQIMNQLGHRDRKMLRIYCHQEEDDLLACNASRDFEPVERRLPASPAPLTLVKKRAAH